MKNGIRKRFWAVMLLTSTSASAFAGSKQWCAFILTEGGVLAEQQKKYECQCYIPPDSVKYAADEAKAIKGVAGATETKDSAGKILSVIVKNGSGYVQYYYRNKKECNSAMKPYSDKSKAITAEEKSAIDSYN